MVCGPMTCSRIFTSFPHLELAKRTKRIGHHFLMVPETALGVQVSRNHGRLPDSHASRNARDITGTDDLGKGIWFRPKPIHRPGSIR